MNVPNNIQVSVCIVTYNQEKYIAECLESLVTQRTNFSFEIIVGEDCSTDNTRSIVKQYAEKYPELIVPLLYEKNVGAVENVKRVYQKAKGKYIAHIDGDDLALSGKLQKQFDVLEARLDCNICSHDMLQIDFNGNSKESDWLYPENQYTLFNLYQKLPFFAHSSKMFRNKYNYEFWNNLLSKPYILDIDIHVENMKDGDIYHIGELLGKYRVASGVSNVNKRVNAALPLGAIRAFDKGLNIYQNDKDKLDEIKRLYALAMLQCAYNYAVYDKDQQLFKEYVEKSFQQKFIGLKQIVFKMAVIFPSIFFTFFTLRSEMKSK